MQGRVSDHGDAVVPLSTETHSPEIYPLRHGLRSPPFRIFVSWGIGNLIQVACLSATSTELSDERGDDVGSEVEGVGGKVVEVRLDAGYGELGEAESRRVAYGSVSPFASLRGKRNFLISGPRSSPASFRTEWWKHVLVYSNEIKKLIASKDLTSGSVLDDPAIIIEPLKEPTKLKAAWELMEIFYVDKQSTAWLPEKLVDWLANYDGLLTRTGTTIYSKLVSVQKKIITLQVLEDDPEYWEGLASALAVGWLDIVVKMLRLHGSYQLEQLRNRETENGLVEAVAVLISKMPRLRVFLPAERLGQCYETKQEFMKEWEKWRGHIAKLDRSAFWFQCGHFQTQEGLRNLLQILLGNLNVLVTSTYHWMELFVSYFLYIRPFTASLEVMHGLAQKCMQLKQTSDSGGLVRLLDGILGENIEVVLAECSKSFGPWLVAHAMDLLMAANDQVDFLLSEERFNLGGISIEELSRLVYAQVLSSHPLTWQIAPNYLASCPSQGPGLLEILLYKQSVQHYQLILKTLEICRLYELENVGSAVMKIAGIYYWKHGRKGAGIYWLQRASDSITLSRISQQMFSHIGRSFSDGSFKQWDEIIEQLGSEVGIVGGLEFLRKYHDFRRSMNLAEDTKITSGSSRQSIEALVKLIISSSTPQQFCLPLFSECVKLLNRCSQPLLTVSETYLLLCKLQELSIAKLHPDPANSVAGGFCPVDLGAVRVVLAANLARAILEES